MNVDNGLLRNLKEFEDLFSNEIGVNPMDMTALQKKNQRVSLHDHTSKLGKQLTRTRAEIRKRSYR